MMVSLAGSPLDSRTIVTTSANTTTSSAATRKRVRPLACQGLHQSAAIVLARLGDARTVRAVPCLSAILSQRIPMAKHLVLVAGNIGAGKTSLTERIGQRLAWRSGYESVADNPIFRTSMEICARGVPLQVFFLGHRAEQYLEAARDRVPPFWIEASMKISTFLRGPPSHGNMAERDFISYHRLFDLVVAVSRARSAHLPQAPVPVLMTRINRRARNMETGITREYLSLLTPTTTSG